ncbi:MAG: PAS domain S-box protein, partial [Anaerolineales bacterium]|nr:PAS domain S-box protein [Anaerolineales bacterium]
STGQRRKNAQLYEQAQQELAERKKAEGALRASEALYQSLVDNIPQNILRKDREGRFVFGNKSFCKILGVSLNELVGKTDFDYYPPEAAEKYKQDDQRVLETGEIYETVEESLLPSGNKKYVRVMKSPIFDSAGEVIGTQGIFWDITERKQAEEALRQSEERFRAIFDFSPIPVVISRVSDGTILQANEHLARLFGLPADLSPHQLVGQQTPNFYNSPADREKLLKSLKKEGYVRNYELQVKKTDGTPFWVLVSLQLMTLKGEPAILAGFYDLTDRKQAEEALQKALARTQLLYNISEALSTLINQRAAFETVLGEYLLLLNVSRGGIMLVDTAGEYISLEASYIASKVVEPDFVIPLKDDIITQYLQQHPFPLIINDVSANPLTQHNPTLQEQVEAILFVPIVSRGQVIGTISAGATPKPRFYHRRY